MEIYTILKQNHIDKINNNVLSSNKLLQTLVEKVTKIEVPSGDTNTI